MGLFSDNTHRNSTWPPFGLGFALIATAILINLGVVGLARVVQEPTVVRLLLAYDVAKPVTTLVLISLGVGLLFRDVATSMVFRPRVAAEPLDFLPPPTPAAADESAPLILKLPGSGVVLETARYLARKAGDSAPWRRAATLRAAAQPGSDRGRAAEAGGGSDEWIEFGGASARTPDNDHDG